MENIRAVIFDCDGVMFDSRQANIDFYNHLLKRFGLPCLSENQIDYIHMATADEAISHIFRDTPYVKAAQEYRLKMDYTPFIEALVAEPGLKKLLELLKGRYGLAVATNRSTTIGRVLEVNGLDVYFDLVVSSLDVTHPKPHPEPLLKIVDHFEILPSEALFVGDTLVDCQTAGAAGVPFVAYKNRALRTRYHVEHLMEIATKVLSIAAETC